MAAIFKIWSNVTGNRIVLYESSGSQLVGAVGGGSVILIVPGCLWARLGTGAPTSATRLLPPVVLIAVGLFIMIAGTYVTLSEIVNPPNATSAT